MSMPYRIPPVPPKTPRVYHVGPATMSAVFTPAGLTNVSDLQAVLDAVEAALAGK